jgi:PAS domain S-box-containing protein
MAGVLLINLFVITMALISMRDSREQYHAQAEVTTHSMAQILAEYTEGLVANMDGAILSVADEYTRQMASGRIDSQVLNAYIARRYAQVPFLDAIRVSDAQGNIMYGTGVDPSNRLSIADRDFFIDQRNSAHAGLVISKPLLGRLSGKWLVAFSRRINSPTGAFAGVVWGAIALDKYESALASVDVGEHGTVSLRDQDMALLARNPSPNYPQIGIGSRNVSIKLHQLAQKGVSSETFDAISTMDKVPRTVTFRRVANRPLYIIVGLAAEDYLAPWRRQVIRTMGAVIGFMAITLLLSMLFFRYWKRFVDSVRQLADQEAKFRIVADFAYEWEYWEGPQRELLHISPSCEQITGYSRSEFVADPNLLFHIIHPDDREVIKAHESDVFGKDEGKAEFRIVRRDGGIRWIAHGCRSVFDTDGKSLGRRASNRDR